MGLPEMKFLKFSILATVLSLSSPAAASNSINGFVQGFVTLTGGVVLVFTNGTRTAPPACSNTTLPGRWAFTSTTAEGQVLLSILLSTYALHQPISIIGTGTCTAIGDAETISASVTNNVQ